ncbi:ribulose-phosphate 3-epimerase [bacterium]|nr:ribulose-phosphate 3-epimerase [bacterium]
MLVNLSILNADLNNIEDFLKPLLGIKIIHMDIMDGKFVKETSFDEKIVKRSKETLPNTIIDCHLMVENPIEKIQKYREAGADYFTFHYETGNITNTINEIHKSGMKAGISINPTTDVSSIVPYLDMLDLVLIMSVWPGRGGQSFIDSSVDKVKFLSDYRKENNLNYLISIDGGINLKTYSLIKPYCDLAVVGSAITKSSDYVKTYNEYVSLFKKEEE